MEKKSHPFQSSSVLSFVADWVFGSIFTTHPFAHALLMHMNRKGCLGRSCGIIGLLAQGVGVENRFDSFLAWYVPRQCNQFFSDFQIRFSPTQIRSLMANLWPPLSPTASSLTPPSAQVRMNGGPLALAQGTPPPHHTDGILPHCARTSPPYASTDGDVYGFNMPQKCLMLNETQSTLSPERNKCLNQRIIPQVVQPLSPRRYFVWSLE